LIALIPATLSWQLTYMVKFDEQQFVHAWNEHFRAFLIAWLACVVLYLIWLILALAMPSLGLAVRYPVTGLAFVVIGLIVGAEMGKRDIHRYFRA
ncbi:hypothetical protein K2Q08_01220, partial [Patescibacteria group bacterium]|nr:hypothetical protein [Patescibacteria group bacterium]